MSSRQDNSFLAELTIKVEDEMLPVVKVVKKKVEEKEVVEVNVVEVKLEEVKVEVGKVEEVKADKEQVEIPMVDQCPTIMHADGPRPIPILMNPEQQRHNIMTALKEMCLVSGPMPTIPHAGCLLPEPQEARRDYAMIGFILMGALVFILSVSMAIASYAKYEKLRKDAY